jgi:predicted NBD/HSP70 family sugar kinase
VEEVSRQVAGPALVRRLNARQVLVALRGREAMSTSDLVEVTGMSRPTVHAAAEHLIGLGWAVEHAGAKTGRGRPSRVFSFRGSAGHVLGVDIGAHRVRATLADLRGAEACSAERTFEDPDMPAGERLDRVRAFLGDVLDESGLAPGRVMTVCVGSSGPISPDGVVRLRTGIPGFLGLDLRSEIRRGFGWDVLVENDCNLAAIGEQWRGLATGMRNFICVLAGERLGAGIVLDGNLVRGHRNGAGGVLFLQLMRNPSDGEGIAHLARELGGDVVRSSSDSVLHRLTGGDPARVDAETVLRAVSEGDSAAAGVLDRAIDPAASAIATIGMLLDPELVVLSGAVARAGEALLRPLRAKVRQMSPTAPEVAASPLGEKAVVTGAVRLALDHAEAQHLIL